MQVSAVTIGGNLLLSCFKLLAGVLAHSSAMISDAIHSASDVLSTLIVIIGVKLAGKDSDQDHPYGHERMECVAAVILAVVLFITGLGIGYSGMETILAGHYESLAVPGLLALVAALVSIAVKEGMYWYTRAAAKKINSSALMADAWHHRSDALSSVGSLVGVAGARLGFPVLDAVASVVICFFILKVSVDIFRDAIGKMTDKACDAQTEEQLRTLVLEQEGVLCIDLLKTRLFGDKIYVDVEIGADAVITFQAAHDIAESTHNAIEQTFPNVKHCMVHVNPKALEQVNTEKTE